VSTTHGRVRLLFAALLIGSIMGCAASYPTVNLQLQRDVPLEARAAARHREIVEKLAPSARTRLQLATRSFIRQFAGCADGGDIEAIARVEVERTFEAAIEPQTELLTLGVLAGSSVDVRSDRGGSIEGLGEMERLRLRLAMDRRSKFMSTLSNLLKKRADTSASIVQNLK
jgi:hypothetical protein